MMNRAEAGVVDIVADEHLARPQLVAWLGYPYHDRFRARSIAAIQDWARWRVRTPLAGRKVRVEQSLSRLEREVDRQLLAGETFRRQVLASLPDDPGIFGNVSETEFARRLADFRFPHWRKLHGDQPDYANEHRTFWRQRRGSLALAAATCAGLAVRPDLRTLLFGRREWAMRAIVEAERLRQMAISAGLPVAAFLIEFRLARF